MRHADVRTKDDDDCKLAKSSDKDDGKLYFPDPPLLSYIPD